MMVIVICLVLTMLTTATLSQAADTAGPKAAWTQNIWPGEAPGSEGVANTEHWQGTRLFDVSIPTLAYYPADKAKANGMCVILCPGGAYRRLFYTDIYNGVAWLNSLGISAAVLKYRVGKELANEQDIDTKALADALRAVRIIRSRAKELGIRADRIGAMGFSAGGNLVAKIIMRADRGNPKADAPLARISARLDFAALLYPSVHDLDPAAFVKDAPPVFVCQASNDPVPHDAYAKLFTQAYKARTPYELHIFNAGGHGFGFRSKGSVAIWPVLCERWLLNEAFKYLETFQPDYLASIGGESRAELKADTAVEYTDVEGNKRVAVAEDMTTGKGGSLASVPRDKDNGRRVAYAFCYVKSDRDQEVRYYFGAEDEVRLWVNGDLICKMDAPRPFTARERFGKIMLKKGLNPVMVKTSQHNVSWVFRFEVLGGPVSAEVGNIVAGEPINILRSDGQITKWRVMNFHLDNRQLW